MKSLLKITLIFFINTERNLNGNAVYLREGLVYGNTDIFLFVSVVMIIGFLGNLIFNKTKISDITILLLLGLLVGPILQLVDPSSISLL